MMLFENVLTMNEKDMIENWIVNYGTDAVTTSSDRAPLSRILRYWDAEKRHLYKMFGEKLILSKEVEITRAAVEMEREISHSLHFNAPEGERSLRNFYQAVDKYVDKHHEEMGENIRWHLMDLFCNRYLAANEYKGSSFVIQVPTGKAIQVQSGCKPVKILGKIAQAFNIEHFEEFRLAHSRITNQKKVKGELCISIHPMDYMTMSDNNSDWESCMSWVNGGCYRRGTVEMMNSESVVVAYLCAKDDMYVPGGKWNNKKWRQLFVVQPDYIVGIKGYPYQHDGLAEEVINWLAELSAQNLEREYAEGVADMTHGQWGDINGEEWRFDFEAYTMYNDFGTCTHKVRVAAEPMQEKHDYEYNYSGTEICMHCGDDCTDFDGEGILACTDCEDVIYCNCCEDRISTDEAIEVDGCYYCSYCHSENVEECPVSGIEHHEADLTTITLLTDDFPVAKLNDFPCYYQARVHMSDLMDKYCVSDIVFSEYFKIDPAKREFIRHGSYWREKYFVRVSQLTEKGLSELFDICDDYDMGEFLNTVKR